jgi:hypothetical protein
MSTAEMPIVAGPMGFEIPTINATIKEKIFHSKVEQDKFAKESPKVFEQREAVAVPPELAKAWDLFQQSKGRAPGSNDLTLIVEFIFGVQYMWFPQDIGSCVYSNTFRPWIDRMCWEIALRGDPEAYTGSGELGITSIAPHCVQYGFAREIAKMRSGDGLYKAPMIKSLTQGIVLCNTPKLKQLNEESGAGSQENYPEPRSAALYRKIGNWAWNAALQPYRTCKLLESVDITNVEQHRKQEDQCKPMIICSSLAYKKIGTHKDGFPIHGINRGDRWDHNMDFSGYRISSDGDRFTRLTTRSWNQRNQSYETYCFNVSDVELAKIYKEDVDVASIGEIEGLPITLPGL